MPFFANAFECSGSFSALPPSLFAGRYSARRNEAKKYAQSVRTGILAKSLWSASEVDKLPGL